MEGVSGTATWLLLEVKCDHPFSDPPETLLNSTFQGFCRTVLFSRIFMAHVWTPAVCGSPVFLGSCSQLFATSQTGWTKCLAPFWYPLPELDSCSAHQPYTAVDFFNPKLLTYSFWFNNIFDFFSVFSFFPLHSWRFTTCTFFNVFLGDKLAITCALFGSLFVLNADNR